LKVLFLIIYVSIIDGLGQILPPFILKFLFDEGIIKKNFKIFIVFSILYFIVGAFIYLVGLQITLIAQKLKNLILENKTEEMLNFYYDIPFKSVLKYGKHYFLSRIYEESKNAVFSSVDNIFGTCTGFFRLSFSVIALFYLSPKVTLLGLLIIPIIYFLSRKFTPKVLDYSKEEVENEAKVRNNILKGLLSYVIVNIFNFRSKIISEYKNKFRIFTSVLYKRVKYSVLYQKMGEITMGLGQIVILILAGYEVFLNKMSFGSFLAFTRIFFTAVYSFIEFFSILPSLLKSFALIERLKEYYSFINQRRRTRIVPSNEIFLNNVSFSYDKKIIFKNLNLRIKNKEKILVIGSNGSGKTTLAYLVSGFLEPDSGEIYTFKLNDISACIQPFYFPEGPIIEYIKDYKSVFKELTETLDVKNLLNKDFDTLSAGQKQRISILLTLLKPAEVYIFDEPLANIDVESKDRIMDTIFEYTRNKTLIVIMHGDERYHRYFDRIINLDELKRRF